VKPFREADAPIVHFLSDDEAADRERLRWRFRNIVKGAYSPAAAMELTRMRACDFNAERHDHRSAVEGRQTRHVALTDEGGRSFE